MNYHLAGTNEVEKNKTKHEMLTSSRYLKMAVLTLTFNFLLHPHPCIQIQFPDFVGFLAMESCLWLLKAPENDHPTPYNGGGMTGNWRWRIDGANRRPMVQVYIVDVELVEHMPRPNKRI